MVSDTDSKIRYIEQVFGKRIEQLCEDTKANMTELTTEVKETNKGLVTLQVEIAGVKKDIGYLATRAYLAQTIGDLKDWSHAQLQTHVTISHNRSMSPPANGKNGNKMVMVLVGAIIALTGAVTALVQFVN